MAFMAINVTRSLRRLQMTTAGLRTRDRKRVVLLDALRFDIYHLDSVVRDDLLGSDATHAESARRDLRLLRTRIDDDLAGYELIVPDTEKQSLKDLHNQVDLHWNSLLPVLRWDAASRRARGDRFLKDVLQPFHAKVRPLMRQITALNERDLDRDEARIGILESQFRWQVASISFVALFLGVILAAVSLRRFHYLQRETKSRYEEVVEARRELRNLSDRLITVQEEERRSLSRELHDEIGQTMSALLVELGRVETASDSESRSERLNSVRRMAETSVSTVRNLALLLRPSMLDDLGLVAALRWQAREVERRSGFKIKMIADEVAEDLPESHRTCTYRVVQEALNNCAKHSQASQVRVYVHRDENDGLTVKVQDDGIGFEPGREKGMGLLGIEERVRRLGGRYSIESKPGKGTALSIYFPLANGGLDARNDPV